jgi:predicted small lipoprotein YifL
MKKRLISLLLITVLALSLLTACGNDGPLAPEDAMEIVMEDMGIDQSDVDSIDTHVTTVNGVACYVVYITVDGEHMQYLIDGVSGEILTKEETDTGHHH